jgi:hypothetical protein
MIIPTGKFLCWQNITYQLIPLQMKHLSDSRAVAPQSAVPGASPSGVSRRSFISFLGIGAASLAVQGCGGGGGASAPAVSPAPVVAPPSPSVPAVPVPAPVTPPVATPPVAETAPAPVPVWLPIPPLVFTQGVASSISIAAYVSASDVKAFTLSLNATPLPSGVTFNSATYAFDYDGQGSMATSEGHVLTAAVR